MTEQTDYCTAAVKRDARLLLEMKTLDVMRENVLQLCLAWKQGVS